MAHLHSVYDTDKHFIIDPVTREIDNKSGKIKLMLGDHNSERFTFEIPRMVDGHDMTLCDSVEIHYININSSTRQAIKDIYQAADVQMSPDSDDVVIFSWLLSGNATKYCGLLNFRITFKCHAVDGTIDYSWSTDIYSGVSVSDGINNTETVATEYSDILEQWKIGLDVLPAITEADDGKVLQVEGGAWTAKELPESGGEDIPNVFPWAKQELFSKEDLVDPAGINSFITIDGVEYYRYHCSASNFVWNNPKPYPGAVTITARAVAQYGTTYGTKLKTVYDDGSNGPDLYVIAGGESRTVTVTTDANKTLAKITGNYDMENWALLDMSVMSCIAGYNIGLPLANEHVPGGVVADPVQDGDTKPVRIGADGRLYTEPDGAVPDEKITEAVNQYLDENGVKSLPDVTEADNGKALQVDNGKWVAKELPESGGSVSGDYIPVPSTAEVGQTIVVKSVDENGKPTEWETADVSNAPCLVHSFELENDAVGIEISGLNITAKAISIRIRNTGNSCGLGIVVGINGNLYKFYGGTLGTGNTPDRFLVRSWILKYNGNLRIISRMANDGINDIVGTIAPEVIESIYISSPYNDGVNKYIASGAVVEIYEGVFPNVG